MNDSVIPHGTVINDRYQVLQAIGRGSTAIVYLVWDCRLTKQWALKAVCKEKIELDHTSVRQEAKLLLDLEHKSLPRIIDVFEWGAWEMIVRDYIEGVNLDDYVRQQGPFNLERMNGIAYELAYVLKYLHERPMPLVYRDLKPANIIVKPDGRIALIDFGIARQYNPLHFADTVPLGTKGYCAPEQYGLSQSGPWTDVFGFGAILYYALSGEHYFCMQSDEVWDAFKSNDMLLAKRVIEMCMNSSIDARYKSVLDAVNELYKSETLSSDAIAPKEVYKSPPGSHKRIYGFIGSHRGVGTTHLAWNLALALSQTKQRVAIILQHQHHTYNVWKQYVDGTLYHDMSFSKVDDKESFFKRDGVTIFPLQSPRNLLKVLDRNFDVFILDFGIEATGLSDFLRCHKKWVVCPSTPWSYPHTNWALNALMSFEDVRYLVNLGDADSVSELSEWLGIKKVRMRAIPYCKATKVDATMLDYYDLSLNVASKKKRLLFWKNA